MKISRQVGRTSQILNLFVQNATVTTGAGLANVVASSVNAYWLRSDATGISSTVMTSSALVGTFSSGGWVQVNSNSTLGWYQFGIPNAALASGDSVLLHIYNAPNMAPLPVEIELTKTDNQTYVSSQSHNVELFYKVAAVTTAAGIPSTDSRSILGTTYLTSVAGIQTVNVSTVIGSAVVTSAGGRLTVSGTVNITSNPLLGVSSVFASAFVTSAAGTLAVDQLTVLGSTPVTSAAGRYTVSGTVNTTSNPLYGVSTLSVPVGVSSVAGSAVVTTEAGVLATAVDWGRTANPNSTVAFTSVAFSSVPATVAGVNVTSVAGSAVVTSAAGVVAAALDWGRTLNPNSTVAFSSVSFSSVPVTIGGVNMTSIAGSAVVTSAAGRLTVSGTVDISSVPLIGVSTISVPVGVTTFAVPVGVSSFGITVGVSSFNTPVGVSSIAPVGVTTFAVPVGVSSVSDKTGYRLDATGSAALTEGYAALVATGTLPQILYEIRSLLAEKAIVGTSMTTKKLDGSTTAEVFTFDSSTAPLSVTRAS